MKQLALSFLSLLMISGGTASAQDLPAETRLEFESERAYKGQFTLRYWYANNSIDQLFTGESLGDDIFANTKLSFGMLNLNTDYWFGILTPEGLGFLGTVFGLGLNLDYSDQLVQNTRLMTYLMDFEFAKIALWHDESFKNTFILSGHYVSYFNTVYDNLLLTSASPFFGVGVGIEGKHPIGDIGQVSYKLTYVPSSRTPSPLPDGLGLLSEVNTQWFINRSLAFNLGYRFNFYHTEGESSAVSAATQETIQINRKLQDMFHGVNLGFTHYF